MLDRRRFLGASAVTPLLWATAFQPVFAATPKTVAVMAKQIDDIISLDPQEAFEFSGNEVCGNLYERLITPNIADPTKIEGNLAERWETSSDGMTTTFHLRDGHHFSSGAPVTADDVAFSLQRAVLLDKSPAFIITQLGLTKDNVAQNIKAIDPKTVAITIAAKVSPSFVFYCLSANVGNVVEKKVALAHQQGNDLGNAWLKTHSAGSGPWMLRSWKASDSVILDANPHNTMAGQLKRILILHQPDPSTQFLGLQRGDVDIARNLSPDQLRQIGGNAKYHLLSQRKANLTYLAMNQGMPELAHPQVSQAIKWAIDYEAIEKNITPNTFVVHQAFLPQGLPGALTDAPFHKDTDKAKKLLAAAGLGSGFAVTLDHRSDAPWGDIAQALQADLGAIGIKATLLAEENRQVITKTRARKHQLAMVEWGSDYMDPNSNAQTFCENPDNGPNAALQTVAWRSEYQDADLTKRAEAALEERDAAKRIADYQELQTLHRERAAFAFLLQEIEVAAMRADVTGFKLGPLADRDTYAGIRKT